MNAKRVAFLSAYVVAVHVQDFFLSFGMKFIGVNLTSLVIASKFVITVILILYFSASNLMQNKNESAAIGPDFVSLLFVFIIIVHLLFEKSDIRLTNRLSSAVSLVTPMLLFYLGVISMLTYAAISRFLFFALSLGFASSAFGIVDLFFLDVRSIWVSFLDIGNYLKLAKEVPSYSFDPINQLPYNFYFDFFGEGSRRRLIGLSGSTLATAYFFASLLAAAIIFVNFKNTPRRYGIFIFVIFLGLILSLGRGAILALTLSALLTFSDMYRLKNSRFGILGVISGKGSRFVAASMGLIAFILTVFTLQDALVRTLSGSESSIIGHIRGTRNGLDQLTEVILLGNGLSSSGGAGYSGTVTLNTVGENAFLVMSDQLGVIAMLLFSLWILSKYRDLFKHAKINPSITKICLAGRAALLVMAVSGITSEQLLTFTTFPFAWILVGAIWGRVKFYPHEKVT